LWHAAERVDELGMDNRASGSYVRSAALPSGSTLFRWAKPHLAAHEFLAVDKACSSR
jgi:hypothetical protein